VSNHAHLRLRSAGLGLPQVIGAVCRCLAAEDQELTRPTRKATVALARRRVARLATRELSFPGSEVARRFNQDLSAVSRAGGDSELMRTAVRTLKELIQ
jgi:hypothetical protein